MTDKASEQTKTLADIGRVLLYLQSTEGFIQSILLFVLQKPRPGGLDKAAWDADSAQLEKMTLGQLIFTLRSRADIHPEFDGILTRFLEDRNTLAHRLKSVGDPAVAEGQREISLFLHRLSRDMYTVFRVFGSLMLAYGKQSGFPSMPQDGEIETLLGNMLGIQENTFFIKDSQAWDWKED